MMKSRRSALSLIEAVLALALLVVAYLPLSQLYHGTLQDTIRSRNQLVAQHLATNFFELYAVKVDAILYRMTGKGTMTSADLLAHEDIRDLLTGGVDDMKAVIQLGRFTMKVQIERAVGGALGVDQLETTLEWNEETQRRSKTYARVVVL